MILFKKINMIKLYKLYIKKWNFKKLPTNQIICQKVYIFIWCLITRQLHRESREGKKQPMESAFSPHQCE